MQNDSAPTAVTPARPPGLLTRERVMLWATAFAFAWLGLLAFDALTHITAGITNAKGEHLGRDFINYWSSAQLAASGDAASAYDLKGFAAFQKTLAGPQSEFKLYSYPPVALLLSLPLAALPFIPALLLWFAAALSACYSLLRKLADRRAALLCLIAPPAAVLNIMSGQNGHFTAVLMAGGLYQLEKRPALAGCLFGLLSYKPQVGLLLPLALAAGRHWRAFFSAAATVLLLCCASHLAFGAESWIAFLQQLKVQRLLMEEGTTFWHRMPTIFASARALGFSVCAAYGLQAVSAALAAGVTFILWRGNAALPLRAAGLMLALFLATPYAWDYDMVMLAFAMLWITGAAEGKYLPREQYIWAAVMLLPLLMMVLTKVLHVNLAPLVLWAALWCVLERRKLLQPLDKSPAPAPLTQSPIFDIKSLFI